MLQHMADAGDLSGQPRIVAETADFVARGLAQEAVQAVRSHEKFDDLKFANIEKDKVDFIKLMQDMRVDMNNGFRSYDNKFWTLAITMISLLGTAVAALVFRLLFMHV